MSADTEITERFDAIIAEARKADADRIAQLTAEVRELRDLRDDLMSANERDSWDLHEERAAHERTKADRDMWKDSWQGLFDNVQVAAEQAYTVGQRLLDERNAAQAKLASVETDAAAMLQACVDIVDAMATEYAGHEKEGGEQFNAFTVLSAACWRLKQRASDAGRALAARVSLWRRMEMLLLSRQDEGNREWRDEYDVVFAEMAALDKKGRSDE